MAPKKQSDKPAQVTTNSGQRMPIDQYFNKLTGNTATMRSRVLQNLLDPRRNIDTECGYPDIIDIQDYKKLYDREGIATRVVSIYSEESWALDPEIKENEDDIVTDFEQAWLDFDKERRAVHYLQRLDELSGIGHFGVLLFGLDDGKELNEPVEGIADDGTRVGNTEYDVLYMRPFDESLVTISSFEQDSKNPRFGMPTTYNIKFHDVTTHAEGTTGKEDTSVRAVHWTRVMHAADNIKSSEVFGVPRQRPVFNRLYDLRKLLGGSGEMFWKGAFPGIAFEVDPTLEDATLDKEATRAEFEAYSNGLQRYLAVSGVTAKSLSVQVADPSAHVKVQLEAIAITLGVPLRVLIGSEQAKLAADQDSRAWNKRLERRQDKYITPNLVRPFIKRLQVYGVLPEIDEYEVVWPDLNAPTDADKADVAVKLTEALAKYAAGGVDTVIAPAEFLTMILKMDAKEVEAIAKAAIGHIAAAAPDDAEGEIVHGRNPVPAMPDPVEPTQDPPPGQKPAPGQPKPAPKTPKPAK